MHVHLPSYPPQSPYPTPPPPPAKKNCQIRIPCQFKENYPPLKKWILCQKNLPLPHLPPPAHSPRPHTPPPTPRPIFFLIWIICQLDLMYVFFYKLTKNLNIKKTSFFIFRAGRGCGGEWGLNIMYKCKRWHFYSSRNTNVPNYSEMRA